MAEPFGLRRVTFDTGMSDSDFDSDTAHAETFIEEPDVILFLNGQTMTNTQYTMTWP